MNLSPSDIVQTSAFTGKGTLLLTQARVPVPLIAGGAPQGSGIDRDGNALVDILIKDDSILAVLAPSAGSVPDDGCRRVALEGRHVWPLLVDVHTHLDKGHTVNRAPDSGGTHGGARDATTADRLAHWNGTDLARRMEFGLSAAYAHGVAAIRTHLDSHEGQAETTWAAFCKAQQNWAGRIDLQAVGLVPIDVYDTGHAERLADIIAEAGGLLGGVTRASGGTHGHGLQGIDGLLDNLFRLARERDLDVDLHVDEAAKADALPHVARATIRNGYEGRVTCGHCCSLALLPEEEAKERFKLLADAGITIVTLPPVNMYLQDRQENRTPRWRGVTPVKELMEAGIQVAVAGDNCRDPFYAYGDHDMLDTWRQSIRILHLDHPVADSVRLAAEVPASMMNLKAGMIGKGRDANLMIMEAWSLDQVIARPQSDRIVVRKGRTTEASLPSYRLLQQAPAEGRAC